MKEKRAYDHLKRLFPAAHWVRVENYLTPGTLDVNVCYKAQEAWIEIKQFKRPKNTGIIKLDTKKKSVRDQIAWGVKRRRAGGRTFYYIAVDSEFFLISGAFTAMLAAGVTYSQLKGIQVSEESLFNA